MITRVVQAFGLTVSIESDAPDLFPLLTKQLPPFPGECGAPTVELHYRLRTLATGGAVVMRGRRTVATVPDVPAACTLLVTDLQAAIARQAAGWTFVHAGVVAIDGRALLLPGRSRAGKSTLVAALLRAGAGYGSDEFAVIDSAGRVHPYARPVALRTPDQAFERVPATVLGGRTFDGSLSVAAVVVTEYRPGADFAPRLLSPGQTTLHLLQHCLGVRGRPAETVDALRQLADEAIGLAGPRGDAEDAARNLLARARGHWHHL